MSDFEFNSIPNERVDLLLDQGVIEALAHHAPSNDEWTKHEGLEHGLTGGVSGNFGPLAQATRLWEYERQGLPLSDRRYKAVVADWNSYYIASKAMFMGDEWGSTIYGHRHLIPNVMVADWTLRHPGEFSSDQLPLDWISAFWQLYRQLLTPDGYWCGIGQRSGGHGTKPSGERAAMSWLGAVASANEVTIHKAIGWCKTAGAGLSKGGASKLQFAGGTSLQNTLAVSWQHSLGSVIAVKYRVPFHLVSNSAGEFGAWIDHNDNGNTPPVLGVVWTVKSGAQYLPANGGPHFREKFAHSFCSRQGNMLLFTSDLQPDANLELPDSADMV